jgi:hypothetical protein
LNDGETVKLYLEEFMMRKSLFSNVLAIMTLLLAMASTSYLSAQDDNAAPQQPPQTSATTDPSAQPQDAKVFTGMIMKKAGAIVLKDTTDNATYQLDDQKKAKSYIGKAVKVTGSLDASGNTIHVQQIEITS